jgi:hypothetical protein
MLGETEEHFESVKFRLAVKSDPDCQLNRYLDGEGT